ncbi:MAG TPA: PilN domain-containing protein [Burkholderiales bacterium]|nr:PilN domain-containing protein [Burkholderiales bacterium]
MSQQINLFSPVFLKRRKIPYSAAVMLRGLALIVALAVLAYGFLVYQTDTLSKQVSETDKKAGEEQERLNKLTSELPPQQPSTQLQNEIKNAEAQLKARQEMVDALKHGGPIGSTEGYSQYMLAFARQAVDGLWLTGFDIVGAGGEMVITGRTVRADLVPAFVQRLSQEPVMKGKQFASLRISVAQQAQGGQKSPGNLVYLDFILRSVEEAKSE